MTYAELLQAEQLKIESLKQQIKNLAQPRRTISYQVNNMKSGNRNTVQRRLVAKRDKLKLNKQIASSEKRILSFSEAVFGV